jgi:hypothetical protein
MVFKHPDIETIVKSIADWMDKNYIRTDARFPLGQENAYKFYPGVTRISKIWQENGYWVVDAMVQFVLKGNKSANMSFQVNEKAEIVGVAYRP